MGWTGAVTPRCRHNNTPLSPCGDKRVSYPLLLSRARTSRSVIRVKTPFIAGVYTEYSSLLHDMDAAIAAPGWLWKKLYWQGLFEHWHCRSARLASLHEIIPDNIQNEHVKHVVARVTNVFLSTLRLFSWRFGCIYVSTSGHFTNYRTFSVRCGVCQQILKLCKVNHYGANAICTLTLPPGFLGNDLCSSVNDGGVAMCVIVFVTTKGVFVPGNCCLQSWRGKSVMNDYCRRAHTKSIKYNCYFWEDVCKRVSS